ncbi:MAG TPA: hypothetical protein DCE58_04165 [Cryomorphaceae bacterium]|nr:hypothetical protein [Cryomorphaceae bacterium]
MKTFSISCLCMAFLSGCAPRLSSGPKCLPDALTAFQTWCCASGAHLDKYSFQGQPVYLFEPGTCGADMPTYVLDQHCDTLGFLGGFAGFTQIQGIDFASNASFQGSIWKN